MPYGLWLRVASHTYIYGLRQLHLFQLGAHYASHMYVRPYRTGLSFSLQITTYCISSSRTRPIRCSFCLRSNFRF